MSASQRTFRWLWLGQLISNLGTQCILYGVGLWMFSRQERLADFALVAAWKADRLGNLVFRKTARNFNPLAATCGRICIAEAEELVEAGALDPDQVHTPGVYVHRVVVAPRARRIEQRTVRQEPPCR